MDGVNGWNYAVFGRRDEADGKRKMTSGGRLLDSASLGGWREVAGAGPARCGRLRIYGNPERDISHVVKLPVSFALRPPGQSLSRRARENASLFGAVGRTRRRD